MIRSIFGKMLFSHIAVILITTLTLGLLMSFLVRNYMTEARQTELLREGQGVLSLITPFWQTDNLSTTLEGISKIIGANAWLMDHTGEVIAGRSPERWIKYLKENPEELKALFTNDIQSWIRTSRKHGAPAVVAVIPVPNTAPPSSLFIYSPITAVNKAVSTVEQLLLFSLLTGMAAALAIGFFISRNLTKPIESIIDSADKFAKGEFAARANVTGSDEIARLGRTFNSMAGALADVEQNRRDFLANVSHELKTPVASIQALAESLADGLITDQAQQQRYLNNIVAETGRIDRLIHDLLDMSQLEAGEISLNITTLDLAAFVRDHANSHQHMFSDDHLQISVNSPPNLPPVKTDPYRLNQVLNNLVSNALRHAPQGSEVQITLTALDSSVSVSVADQGPGIPAADIPHIFDRFYRVEKSRVRSDGGTGLGLAISKKIMTALKGTIAVDSVEGQGATFIITLPTK